MDSILKLLGLVALADTAATEKAVTDAIVKLQGDIASRDAFLTLHDAKTLDEVTGKIKGMVPAADKAALEQKLAAIEAEKAVTQAFSDRKLTEAQREWAVSYATKDLKAFNDFCAKAPVVVPGKAPETKTPADKDTQLVALSDDEVKIYRKLGLSPEQIEECRKSKNPAAAA